MPSRRSFLFGGSAGLLASLPFQPGSAAAAAEPRSIGIPREVLAFYYGWYGNPRVSGRWVHWAADADGQHALNISDTPRDGLYDSHDPAEVEHQVAEARGAGITGFISSWQGQGSFTDHSLPLLLDAAGRHGLKIAAYIENIRGSDEAARKAQFVADMLYLLRTHGGDPAWLKVAGRPVVFLYGLAGSRLPLPAWREVLTEVRTSAPHGLAIIGPSYNPISLGMFDGAHEYTVTGAVHSLSLPQMASWAVQHYRQRVALSQALGKISCVTVIPGYDDTTQHRPPPRPITPREGGRTYAALWQAAIAAEPDWVLISTWNEWHEGTEIEPSQEWGPEFLLQTRRFATQFLDSGWPPPRR